MGSSLSRSFSRFWSRNERRLLLVGLDAAGKTTILYHLRLGKTIASIPTVGFNVETVKFDGFKLNIWVSGRRQGQLMKAEKRITNVCKRAGWGQDVGGQDSLRPYWRHHFTGTQVKRVQSSAGVVASLDRSSVSLGAAQGIVFVLDSADMQRLELAKAELNGMLLDSQLQVNSGPEACLLIILNKRDLPDAHSVEELTTALDFEESCKQSKRPVRVQPTVATTGEGLNEGMTWLCENMTQL
ncbi:hypothetical protein BBJ28_00027150 [Nothophytophthora sp. Chile5]|nr:hypothetical protein BBJ28_00027150 [Nothophytophthora sp. Chile5]